MSTPRLPHWLQAVWPWLAAILSGFLLALSLPPWDQSWLVWIGLTPLLCAVWFSPARRPRPFLLGWLAGIVFYTTTFQWLSSLGPLFKAPILMGIPFLLALYLALYVGLWAWSVQALAPSQTITASSSIRHLGIGALAACSWVALDWTRGWLFSGFGWNGLGVALHGSLPMIQIVDITGVLGLTWLIAFCNVMAVVIVRRLIAELGPQFLKRIRWEFSGTMLLVAIVFMYGAQRTLHPPSGPTTALKVATIQPNVPQDVKFDEASEDMILEKLEKQTSFVAILQPHVILWPEAPAVRGMFADKRNYDLMMKLASQGSFDLLIGSLDYEPDDQEADTMKVYNAAYLLRENGLHRDLYRKVHLVPFGEYLPFREFLPQFIGNLVASDLEPGKEGTVFTLTDPAIRIAPLICFEDSLGDLTRRTTLGGAQVLVNLTNDGWFQKTVGSRTHLANAVFRAVENRRPLVRSANTGLTGIVHPTGRWEEWLPAFTEGTANKVVEVPLQPPTTFYMRYGDWVGYLSSAVLFIWAMARVLSHFLRRRRSALQAQPEA